MEKVAQNKDMSVKALLKFYIGQGLQQDLSDLSANHLLDAVAVVLGEHLGSAVETEQLMREICQKSAPIVMPAMMDARSVVGDRSAHHQALGLWWVLARRGLAGSVAAGMERRLLG